MLKMEVVKSWAAWSVECAGLMLLSTLLAALYVLRASASLLSRVYSRDHAVGTQPPQFGQTDEAAQAFVVMAGGDTRAAAQAVAEKIRQRLGITVNRPGEKAIHAILLTLTTDTGPTAAMRLAGTNFHSITKFKPHVAAALSLIATASVAGPAASVTAAVSAITIPIIAAPVVRSLATVANVRLHSERSEDGRSIRSWAADVFTGGAWVTRTTAEVAYDQPPPDEPGESKRKREHREHERSVRALRQLDPVASASFRAKDRARKSAAMARHLSTIQVDELGGKPPVWIDGCRIRHTRRMSGGVGTVGGWSPDEWVEEKGVWTVSDAHFVGEHVRIRATSETGIILAMYSDQSLTVSLYSLDQLEDARGSLIAALEGENAGILASPGSSSLSVHQHSSLATMNSVLLPDPHSSDMDTSTRNCSSYSRRFHLSEIVSLTPDAIYRTIRRAPTNDAPVISIIVAAQERALWQRREQKKAEMYRLDKQQSRAMRLASRSSVDRGAARAARAAHVKNAIETREAVRQARMDGNTAGGHWRHEDCCQCKTCKLLRRLRTEKSHSTLSLAMLALEGVRTEATEKAVMTIEDSVLGDYASSECFTEVPHRRVPEDALTRDRIEADDIPSSVLQTLKDNNPEFLVGLSAYVPGSDRPSLTPHQEQYGQFHCFDSDSSHGASDGHAADEQEPQDWDVTPFASDDEYYGDEM